MCYHSPSRRSAQKAGGVQEGRPCRLYARGEGRGEEAERNVVGGGTGGDPGGCPCPSRMPPAAGEKYGGMADGAAVNSKWYGTGCAGMARCPIPAIRPKSPITPQIM